MAAVPITLVGIETKDDGSSGQVTIVGMASITGLGVGGGPIKPPLGFWGGSPPTYPDQGLPGSQPHPDQGLPGQQPYPDQGLPGQQPGGGGGGSQGGRWVYSPAYGWVWDPGQGGKPQPGQPPRPDQGLPGSQPGIDQSLPEEPAPEPK